MSGPPPKSCAGPRNSVSRGVAGHDRCNEQVTFQNEMEALVLAFEELSALANSLRTELDIFRNMKDQVKQMHMIFEEFGWKGQSYVKRIDGKNYVIFKGKSGLRHVFGRTKYLSSNAKVVSYGLGRQLGNVMRGSFVSIMFVSALNVIETIVSEDKDFIDATAQFTTDVVKTIAAGVASAAVGAIASTVAAPVVLAVGASIVVGIVVALALDKVDAKFAITTNLSAWLRKEYEESKLRLEKQTKQVRREWMWCNSPEGAMACMQRLFGGY